MKPVSQIICFVLAMLIGITAQSAAVARTMPNAAGQMVICTGAGPMMVYFDQDGEPTGAPRLCPDYALSLIVALDIAPLSVAPIGAWFDERMWVSVRSGSVLRLGAPNARGPPEF